VTDERATPWYRRLHWQIFAAMALGAVAGAIGGSAFAEHVAWMGALFVRLLRMVIVPLVLTSVVSGVASIGGGRDVGRLFGKTFAYYVGTSLLAILVGLVFVTLIRPGVGAELAGVGEGPLPEIETPTSIADMLLRMVPTNPLGAAASGDILGLIVFSILLGVALGRLPEEPRGRLLGVFEAGFQAMMVLTSGIIRLAPFGVFGLIVNAVASTGIDAFRALGWYALTVAGGLATHLFLVLPLLLIGLGRIRPWVHFRNMAEPLAMAFSTSSSAATLPVTIRAVEQKVGVSNRISSFVLPMGATINMDGTALYECAGVLFIAQALGIDLSFAQQMLVVLTALLASIGTAAIPSAGLVMIFIVLEAVELRGPQVDLIVGAMLAIDRPLDMARTAVNVFSDSCGAAIIARSEGETSVDLP
jgi:Na+/H+-dicarboxylate symporter